jgi:hypothetical protein
MLVTPSGPKNSSRFGDPSQCSVNVVVAEYGRHHSSFQWRDNPTGDISQPVERHLVELDGGAAAGVSRALWGPKTRFGAVPLVEVGWSSVDR